MAHYTYLSIYPQQFLRLKRLVYVVLCFLLCPIASFAQADKYIYIHFLYGSKPASCCKKTEEKWFGGLHGGHVSIQIDSQIIGFEPKGRCHIFSSKKDKHCTYIEENHDDWAADTAGEKYLTIRIPLRQGQYDTLKIIQQSYLEEPPFDYAFFGMRCAASTYEILSLIGIFPHHSRFVNICTHFYPKPLRKKMKRMAAEQNWQSSFHEGRSARKWEKDHFLKK